MTNWHLNEKKLTAAKGEQLCGIWKGSLFSELFHPLKGYTFPSHKRNILYTAKKVNWDCDQTGQYKIRKNVGHELSTGLISQFNSSQKQKHLFMLIEKGLERLSLILTKETSPQDMHWTPCPLWPWCCLTIKLPVVSVQELWVLIPLSFHRSYQFTVNESTLQMFVT